MSPGCHSFSSRKPSQLPLKKNPYTQAHQQFIHGIQRGPWVLKAEADLLEAGMSLAEVKDRFHKEKEGLRELSQQRVEQWQSQV